MHDFDRLNPESYPKWPFRVLTARIRRNSKQPPCGS